jgi:hypothetical protein
MTLPSFSTNLLESEFSILDRGELERRTRRFCGDLEFAVLLISVPAMECLFSLSRATKELSSPLIASAIAFGEIFFFPA